VTISRIEALTAAVTALPEAAFVVTCGATSREMAATVDRPGNLYLLDSMGLTTSVAFGASVGLQDSFPHVVAIDGDGSLLMNLGSLATIGAYAPSNLTVLLLDNGEHASAGGMPTISERIDFCGIARGCGFEAVEVTTADHVIKELRSAAIDGRPNLIRVRIARGNAAGVPWLHADPVVLGDRFRSWLRSTADSAPPGATT
jgi:sulfopyruvate decarboxylase subunit beta